jgi:hypothetical protein
MQEDNHNFLRVRIMDSSKRMFVGSLAAVGALGAALTSASAQAASANGSNLVRVGPGGDFATIQDAIESISDASESNPYAVLIEPGRYNLASVGRPIVLRPWVSLVGVDRNAVWIETDGDNNILCANDVVMSNISVSGPTGTLIQNNQPQLKDFVVNNVRLVCDGVGPAFGSTQFIARLEMRDCTIQTQGTGLDFPAGGRIYLHDCNIHLFGSSQSPHIGIDASSYCRIFVFGGKIGSGYGYDDIVETDQDVIGVRTDANFDGRVVMHGVWSICRNNGAPAGTNINCIRVEGPNGWVRLFGGYYQAENDIGQGRPKTITNPGQGKIEIYGTRILHYGEGPVYSTNQIGLQRYSKVDDGKILYRGGLLLFNAAAGGFTVKLPWAMATEQYILKKIDNTNNPVTISGNGYRIDGQTSVILARPYDKVHLRFDGSNYLIV